MSKSRSFSIYLLKRGHDSTNSLKDGHRLKNTNASRLPKDASLFILDNHPREPWWKEYFGIEININQATKGALIFLPASGRCFALSFGHVYHNLKDECYEYDFGLRVTLNSIDPDKLKSTDVLEPDAARRQRTQVPVGSDLTGFDFDRDSKILKSLTGKVKDEYEEFFRHATGSSNLRISSALSSAELVGLCEKLLTLYESSAYRATFPDIQNITPVRDPTKIETLNVKLIDALHSKSEDLHLAIPDIIDYSNNVSVVFSGGGKSPVYDDASLDRYYEYLKARDIALNTIDISGLKKHRLILTDEGGVTRNNYLLFKCLIYDTSHGPAEKTYHLNEGDWYEVEDNYVAKLKEYLDPFCKDVSLPDFSHGDEGTYNEVVANGDAAFLCFDKKNIAPAKQSQIEPCDLFSIKNKHAVFIHVKRSTFSTQLSHLFNQGSNAIRLLKLEPKSVTALCALIDELAEDANKAAFREPVDAGKLHVIFAIITHKDKTVKSDNLPLFSRISLMRVMKDLQAMSVKAHYGFVRDASP